MSRFHIFAALVAGVMTLAACAIPPVAGPTTPSPGPIVSELGPVLAPLAGTHVDDEALRAAWKTADAGLYLVDAARSFRFIVDGSPKAIAIANGLESLRTWLNVATEAQQAGQQASADRAFAQARLAYLAFRAALESRP